MKYILISLALCLPCIGVHAKELPTITDKILSNPEIEEAWFSKGPCNFKVSFTKKQTRSSGRDVSAYKLDCTALISMKYANGWHVRPRAEIRNSPGRPRHPQALLRSVSFPSEHSARRNPDTRNKPSRRPPHTTRLRRHTRSLGAINRAGVETGSAASVDAQASVGV